MMVTNKYLYDTQPLKSAYAVPKRKMFSVLTDLYNDICSGNNKFVNNNTAWVYAFNHALLRRYEIDKPSSKKAEIKKYRQQNEDFLQTCDNLTYGLKAQ